MIGLDTNVLLRYLLQDDPDQAARANQVLDDAAAGGLFLTHIVLCEMVWVLEDVYHRDRTEIAEALERILLTGQFTFEEKELVRQAVDDYRTGKGDVSDYLIGHIGANAACDYTATFDKGLKSSPLFKLL
jgi:predicted nucleic-acid-binding protein